MKYPGAQKKPSNHFQNNNNNTITWVGMILGLKATRFNIHLKTQNLMILKVCRVLGRTFLMVGTKVSYYLITIPSGDCFLGEAPDWTMLSIFLRMKRHFGVNREIATSVAGAGRVAAQSPTSLTECLMGLPYLAGAFLFEGERCFRIIIVFSRRLWWLGSKKTD